MYPSEIDERDYKFKFSNLLKMMKRHGKSFFLSFVSIRSFIGFVLKNFHF